MAKLFHVRNKAKIEEQENQFMQRLQTIVIQRISNPSSVVFDDDLAGKRKLCIFVILAY